MKELRRIDSIKVRNMCIDEGYYTCGSCEEYDEMFNLCKTVNPSTQIFEEIATNIIEHSDIQELRNMSGLSKHELIRSIMWELINYCTIVYIVDDDEIF